MYKLAISAAVVAVLATSTARAEDQSSPQCAALAKEAGELRGEVSGAAAKKAGGFLANVAGRALAYAPAVETGDGVLERAAGQAAENAAHEQAYSGLSKVQENGRAADPKAAKARLKEIRKESAELGCPNA
jgi:hypothetical protein